MAKDQNETLDVKISNKSKEVDKYSKVVKTALRTLECYQPMRDKKETSVKNARDLYNLAFSGEKPKRINSLPSYLLNQVIELFVTLVKVPDFRLVNSNLTDEKKIIMSKYLETKVREGGFYELMEGGGWSGFHELGLAGVIYVTTGTKTKGMNIGMPEYRLLPARNCGFNPSATRFRTRTGGSDAFRFYYLDSFELESAEKEYPGILELGTSGDIPTTAELEKKDEMSDEQLSQMKQKDWIQVLRWVDKDLKISSIIVGAKACEYKTLKDEAFPHLQTVDGEMQEVIPVSQGMFFPVPEGLEGVGPGEAFYNLALNEGLITSAQLNNTTDNYNAPAIISIPDVAAKKVFQQIKMARKSREEEGKSGVLAFDPNENGGKPIGQASISYIRNDFPAEETIAIIAKFEQIIKRMGFNLDFFFTDPTKTLGQTEIDIKGTNSNISKILGRNDGFFKFNYQFGYDKIAENGDIHSKKPFGNDIELEVEGESVKVADLPPTEEGIDVLTEGEIVGWFKDNPDTLIETNTKSGLAHNDILEERALTRRLNRVPDGSPEQLRILNALSLLGGGQKINKESLMGAEGTLPETQGKMKSTELENI